MKYTEILGIKSKETVRVKPSLHYLILLEDEIKLIQIGEKKLNPKVQN